MITISILGLDQFVVGRYSREHTENLAQAFECEEDEINFYAPNSMIFHKGVEQTSWNILVIVRAEERYEPHQEMVAQYIMQTLKDFAIHIEIHFEYYHEHDAFKLINDDYPLYLTESNIVNVGEDEDEDECDHNHDEEDVYLGDVFAGMEDALDAANPEPFDKDKN